MFVERIKSMAGEVGVGDFPKLAQMLNDGRWVQFNGTKFVDGSGGIVDCTPSDIKEVEWLKGGESFADFVLRKKHESSRSEVEIPNVSPVEDFGLEPALVERLKGAGIHEIVLGGDLTMLNIPAADIVKIQKAIERGPI